jgi:hypothetical protein
VKKRSRLTRARLRELLHYDPETGEFRWRKRVCNHVREGDLAGNVYGRDGHRFIRVGRRMYSEHQLAWSSSKTITPLRRDPTFCPPNGPRPRRAGLIRRQPGVPRSIEVLVPPERLPLLQPHIQPVKTSVPRYYGQIGAFDAQIHPRCR